MPSISRTQHFHTSSRLVPGVQVTLLPSREAFLCYAGARRRQEVHETQALMLGFSSAQMGRGWPQSELVFYQERFTAANVAHEVFHALLWAFRQAGRTLEVAADEELFATLQGLLTQSIWEWGKSVE